MKICGTVVPPLARCDHLRSQFPVARHVDLGEGDVLLLQKRLGIEAIGAIGRGVDFDGRHDGFAWFCARFDSQFIWGLAPRRQPARTPGGRRSGRRPAAAPARRRRRWRRRSARRRSEPGGGRPPRPCARSGTRNAPCTFWARSACDRPTCCAVALTRLSAASATATPLSCAIALASSADWLKRRAHSRRQCSGTGIERIGVRQQFAPGARHPAAHGGREVEPVAVFQRMHQRARDVVVAHRGAGPVIGRRIGDRLHRQHARAGVVGERNAEPLAIGRRDQRELRPARRAQAVAADRLAAGRAKRRQRHVQRAAEKRAEWRGHAARARRVYALGNRFLHWP